MSGPLPFHYKASFQNSKWYKAPDLTILDTAGKPVATYEYGDGGEGKAMLCGAAFEIKQRSRWWDSPLDIFHGGQAVGSMRFTWNNRLVIQIRQNDAAGKKYLYGTRLIQNR